MEARLYDKYVTEVVPALQQKFGYKDGQPDPEDRQDRDQHGSWRLQGQPQGAGSGREGAWRPSLARRRSPQAKKSIANFKLREGMETSGAKVTHARRAHV